MDKNTKHVVIVGAGFGGLQTIQKLASCIDIRITVIDKTNHHLFQPLLYQVATAVLSPADIAIPSRSLTTNMKNVSVIMGEVNGIDKQNKILFFGNRSIRYDYLILAMGARTSYFGNKTWSKYSQGLKSLSDALKIRKNILLSYEKAELAENPEEVSTLLSYVIIGGGPTGVELAGSLAEFSHRIITGDFRNIHPEASQITLIEAGNRLLSSFSEKLSLFTKRSLEKRGVTIILNTRVQNIDEKGVHIKDRVIKAQNIIWAAGVEANPFGKKLGVKLDRAGRVFVDQYCSLPWNPEIFIIGDMANFSEGVAKPLPGVSPVAMQQGRFVADIIKREMEGKKRYPFKYVDKGSMATIGRMDGIAEVKFLKLTGFFGWAAWLFVHLFYLVGFKNKISIVLTWLWSYLTFRAGARLIQEEIGELEKE